MHIRVLSLTDAPLMLEWMKDPKVTSDLRTDFCSKTIHDAEEFIRSSWSDTNNIHLAIASDLDEYMGTVSLKNITDDSAEFAITIRSKAMGRGYAWFGMHSIIQKAFDEYGLTSIYWCVSRDNKRAIRFYDKHRFHETFDIPDNISQRYSNVPKLKWYSTLKGDKYDVLEAVAGCRIVHITTIPTIDAGELSFFEAKCDIPFEIKRVYYISKVPEGVRRGFHAHKNLKQFLFCPFGRIQLSLENKNGREEIELSDPSIGIIIDQPTWREMVWLQKDSVLCVAASDYYCAEDYIRDYQTFAKHYLN